MEELGLGRSWAVVISVRFRAVLLRVVSGLFEGEGSVLAG